MRRELSIFLAIAGLIHWPASSAAADSYRNCVRAAAATDKIESCSGVIERSRRPKELERAYLRRGNALVELKRFQEAVHDFSALIKLNPRIAGYYDNRARAYWELGLFADALVDANATVRLARGYSFGFRTRGSLYAALLICP
jgi:tetratricopeptide (TPR) repeat protein